ncbi:MAG: gliding motility-associated C-terminal domain-containing protein [Bacteroidia bacterium]|nr:gliding motility-associated C-terminal domain-containing protein [Bacteroidia bacterium]
MKNFEDQLKESFDRFEPEVDPKLWQEISRQLPSSSAPADPGAGLASKGLLAKLGIKGIAALVGAGIITAGSLLWINRNEEASPAPAAGPTEITTPMQEAEEVPLRESTGLPSAEAQAEPSRPASAQEPNGSIDHEKIQKSEHALTGISKTGQGESEIKNDSPGPKPAPAPATSGTAAATGEKAPGTGAGTTPPLSTQTTEKQQPVLILSTSGGFAPLSVTAMTNQPGVLADFDFGDGGRSRAGNASHIYTEPGTYILQCEVGGEILQQSITVYGQIPSAFSPNGDGVNDVFTLGEEPGLRVEIRIFSRSGKLMFSGKGKNIAWDGTIDGQAAEAGTYLYDIFATSEGGRSFKQKGTIHLFR